MAMNNWGGVTEHMSKKPKRVFGNRSNRQVKSGVTKRRYGKQVSNFSVAEKTKNRSIFIKLLVLTLIVAIIIYGLLDFML